MSILASDNLPSKRRLPPAPPVFVVTAALLLRRSLLRAADMVVPAYVAMLDRFFGAATSGMLYAVARLRIADLLVEGPLAVSELAARTGTRADALERTLRALAGQGIFRRDPDGRFANNHVSSALVTGAKGNLRGFVEFFGLPALTRTFADFHATLHAGGTAFERVNGRPVWEWMADNPEGLDTFIEGMSATTMEISPSIAAAYPFDEVRTICDVGGGMGIVLAAVLTRHPHLRGILFDSQTMLGEAHAHLAHWGVSDRVQFVHGSFFESVPRGADAYLLKTVVHNWDDEQAVQILRNVRAAMDPGHRLIVADFLDDPDPPTTLLHYMDILGMMVFGGRERSPEAMARLFSQAGFRYNRTIALPASQALFEGVAVA